MGSEMCIRDRQRCVFVEDRHGEPWFRVQRGRGSEGDGDVDDISYRDGGAFPGAAPIDVNLSAGNTLLCPATGALRKLLR